MENFDPRVTPIALCVVTFMQLVLPIALVYRAIDTLITAERKNFTQAWRLRQLLPPATRG